MATVARSYRGGETCDPRVEVRCLAWLFLTLEARMCACSELAMLAQRLASIAPALAAAVAADPCDSPAWSQVAAACISAAGCGSVSTELGLQGGAALRVAAAARVVLVAGRAALETSTERGRQRATAAPTAAQVQGITSLQLTAMTSLLHLMDLIEQPNARAAFANSTAAPQAFLPWLSAVGDALLLCPAPLPGVAGQKCWPACAPKKQHQAVMHSVNNQRPPACLAPCRCNASPVSSPRPGQFCSVDFPAGAPGRGY